MQTPTWLEGPLARGKFILILALLLAICLTAKGGAFSSKSNYSKNACPAVSATADTPDERDSVPPKGHLARITAYWPGEDYLTTHRRSATGVRLRPGFCAVDSRIIPYGSLVKISGLGSYLAVDTGTAVISRKAARESGRSREERSALVIDLFFPNRRAGERFDREGPKFAMVEWGSATLASD